MGDRIDPTQDVESPSTDSKSAGELVKEITADLSTLVRMEIELAKREITELVRDKLRAAGLVVLGGVMALLILPMLLLTAFEALSVLMPRWAAALSLTGALAIFALVTFLAARRFMNSKIVPEQTIASIKEDVEWVRGLKKR